MERPTWYKTQLHFFIIRSDVQIDVLCCLTSEIRVLIWYSIGIEYFIVLHIFCQYCIEYNIVDQNLV